MPSCPASPADTDTGMMQSNVDVIRRGLAAIGQDAFLSGQTDGKKSYQRITILWKK